MAQPEITAREFRKALGIAERESGVQREVLRYLKLRAVFAWNQKTAGRPIRKGDQIVRWAPSEAKGAPDVLGVFPWGQAFMLELKRESGGRLRYHQSVWIATALEQTDALCMIPTGEDQVAQGFDPLLRWWRETEVGPYRVPMFMARAIREGVWLQELRARTLAACRKRMAMGPEKRSTPSPRPSANSAG